MTRYSYSTWGKRAKEAAARDAARLDWLERQNAMVRETPILPPSCGFSVRQYIDQCITDETTPRAASQEGRHE